MQHRGMIAEHGMLVFLGTLAVLVPWTWAVTATQQEEFGNWPEGASPQVVEKRVAENFVMRPFRAQSLAAPDPFGAAIFIAVTIFSNAQ